MCNVNEFVCSDCMIKSTNSKFNGYLYKERKNGSPQKRYYVLDQGLFYKYEDEFSSHYLCYHDIQECHAREIEIKLFMGALVYPFVILNPKKVKTFFSGDEETRKKWMIKLRSLCYSGDVNADYILYDDKLHILYESKQTLVHLAKDRIDDKLVAIKRITKKLTSTDYDCLKNETEIYRLFPHLNFPIFYGSYENSDYGFIVLEYMSGSNLGKKLPVPNKIAQKIVKSVAECIKHLHENDIIHRDIKVDNILYSEKGDGINDIKLCDFGLSQRINKGSKFIGGTPHYMAPEILIRKYQSKCSDMWALGVTAYLLMTGLYPFNGVNNYEIEKSIINMPPALSIVKDRSEDAFIFIRGMQCEQHYLLKTIREDGL
jgi:tRNA A-37 threonylcarbamoyl transferase component Bud32